MEVQGSIGNNTSVNALIAASLARMEERHKKELEAQRKYYDERLNSVQMEARNQELKNHEVRRKERVENDKAQRLLMQEARKCEEAACQLNQELRDEEFHKARQDVLKRQMQKEVSGLFLCCSE
jgi:C4-dicarboxylate-specific signal transduction histidine kinase